MSENTEDVEKKSVIEVQIEETPGPSTQSESLLQPEPSTSSAAPPEEDRRSCWVCYLNEEDQAGDWVAPCRCRGSSKWVHQQCLQKWIDMKQKADHSSKVTCSQCKTEYILIFPPTGRVVYALELCDNLLYGISPFVTATIVIGSIYWTALSYGALTVVQIMGYDEGRTALESFDPLMLLVTLPGIPLMLILGKLIRWEDQLLRLWHTHHKKLPILSMLFGKPPVRSRETAERILFGRDNYSDPLNAARMFCSALLLPSISTLVGQYFFKRIDSNLHKTILGGLTFLAVKGLCKCYLRQQQYLRHSSRTIADYSEELAEKMRTSSSFDSSSAASSDVDVENTGN